MVLSFEKLIIVMLKDLLNAGEMADLAEMGLRSDDIRNLQKIPVDYVGLSKKERGGSSIISQINIDTDTLARIASVSEEKKRCQSAVDRLIMAGGCGDMINSLFGLNLDTTATRRKVLGYVKRGPRQKGCSDGVKISTIIDKIVTEMRKTEPCKRNQDCVKSDAMISVSIALDIPVAEIFKRLKMAEDEHIFCWRNI